MTQLLLSLSLTPRIGWVEDSILGYEGEITLGSLALALVGAIDPSWCDVNPGASEIGDELLASESRAGRRVAWRDIGRGLSVLSRSVLSQTTGECC